MMNEDSVECPDSLGDLSTGRTVKKSGFRSAVEFLMFAFYVSKTLSDTIVVNLLEKSTCLVVLEFNQTNCTEPVSPTTEGKLQQSTADLLLARSVIEGIVPSLLTLLIGPWSDTNGRRPLVLISLAGYTVSAAMWTALSTVPNLHPRYFLLTSVPVSLSGSYVSFFLALYCYISDVTAPERRAVRMSLLGAGCMGGLLLGSLATPYLLALPPPRFGYTLVFAVSTAIMALTFFAAYFFMDESVDVVQSERTPLFKVDHVKEIFTTCFKTRPNHVRAITMCVVCTLLLFVIIMEGQLSVLYMFTQRRFHWDLLDYTRYTSFVIVVAGSSVTICSWLLVVVLGVPDLPLMLAGTVASLAKAVVEGLARDGRWLYVAGSFCSLSILVQPLSRSLLSKLIPSDDLGKIFAFSAFVESTMPLCATPIYTYLYKATLDSAPHAVFWLSVALSLISVISTGTALVLHTRSRPRDGFGPLLDNEENANGSVQA